MVHIEAQSDVVAIWVEYHRTKREVIGDGVYAYKNELPIIPFVPWRKRIDPETKDIVYEWLM